MLSSNCSRGQPTLNCIYYQALFWCIYFANDVHNYTVKRSTNNQFFTRPFFGSFKLVCYVCFGPSHSHHQLFKSRTLHSSSQNPVLNLFSYNAVLGRDTNHKLPDNQRMRGSSSNMYIIRSNLCFKFLLNINFTCKKELM